MLNKTFLATSAIAAAMLTSLPVRAQDKQAGDPKDSASAITNLPVRTDIVITSAGVSEYPEEIGQAVTLIDRTTIEQRQTVAISDLLATVPGVTVSRNGGLGGFTAVRIRGAEGEQTLTLIDGVRVNDPSSPGGGFDFANLLSGSVERIEVLRGPNSVPWGSQAIGGVVNVVTTAPSDRMTGRANVEYGSFDTVFANVGLADATDNGVVKGALNAGFLKTTGISAAAVGTEPDGYRQFGATGRLEIALSDAIKLDVRGYYANSRADLDGFPPPAYVLADDAEYSKTQEMYGYAGLNADLANGAFHNRLSFTIANINRDNFDPATGTAPTFFARGRSERYAYQGDVHVIEGIRLVGGVEHEVTRFNDGTTFTSRGVTSGYAETILSPFTRLTVTGGIRYDHDSAYGGHTSWGANAIYSLPTNTRVRASYAEGFKAPTLYQLNAPFYGNSTLVPETARSYDIGIEQSVIGGSVTASATWFHRDTRNQIDFDLGTFTYGNIAKTRAQGIELALGVRPTSTLTMSANYSFIDAINLSPGANFGKQLSRRPRQTLSASIDWKTPINLALGVTVQTVGNSFDDAGNFTRLAGYTIAGIRAQMPIGARLSVYGRVDNLFDERYMVVQGYGTPGRAAYGGIRFRFN